MRFSLPVILALFLALSINAQEGASSAQSAYERANSLFEAKKLSESDKALDEALRADPKNVPALTLKAKIAISTNRSDIAGDCLRRAVAADPSSWYAHFLFGFWYYLRSDSGHALSELRTARALNPKDARAPLYLGLTYEQMGDTQKPILFYREAMQLEQSAGQPDPYTMLAYSRALFALGRTDECEKVLDRALELYPQMRDIQYEFGRLLLKKGDAVRAAQAGEAALRLQPGDNVTELQIRYLLVRAYKATGQNELAAKQSEAIEASENREGK